ncbi:MAG TPA: RagB/SusD family nutrient uptake outer membrane protein, partial [Longimicrobiaceae bacterium]|nr:RagB/SusD family nutrient uptake outer membrane protein [Longimicrobiaceae bacterium]
MNRTKMKVAPAGWGRWSHLGVAVLALSAAACDVDSLTELPDPDIIGSQIASDTANLPILRNGVQFEFARALTGPAGNNNEPGIAGTGGLLADELWYSSTFPTMREIDGRNTSTGNSNLANVYRYVHRARNLAERTAETYAASPRANSADHALVTNYAAFTYVYFGENFCSGVPFSQAALTGELTFGPANTTQQILELALQRFDQALTIATASGNAAQINMARVGRGRTLLNLNRPAEAAAAVAAVPTSFEYTIPFSVPTNAPGNGIFYHINSERRSSAATDEGTNGLHFFNRVTTSPTIDPRAPVTWVAAGGLSNPNLPQYSQGKYPNRGSPMPVANGVEARLIEAEAQLRLGTPAGLTQMLTILNTLRSGAGVAGLAPLAAPANATAARDLLFRERAFWLWLTGHRLGDLRRLIRQYGMTANQVFPVG